jgi:putative phage-type endonuclease
MASASLLQRTPAWHAARKGKLTASNIGAAIGLCPWTSRNTAFARAMGLDSFAGNDATQWGTLNEPNGILAYSAHTGNLVENTGLHVHPATSWLAGSPDGLVGTEGLLEVKCPYWRRRDGSRVHKEVPAHYYMQVNLCLECANREWCDFISWTPEGYRIYRITRDRDLHELLMPQYLKFFAAMQRMAKAPPPMSAEDKAQIVDVVQRSMDAHIDYHFWDRAELLQSPPSPEPDSPPHKRAKLSAELTVECRPLSPSGATAIGT